MLEQEQKNTSEYHVLGLVPQWWRLSDKEGATFLQEAEVTRDQSAAIFLVEIIYI